MQREENFDRIFFPESVIKEALQALELAVDGETRIDWKTLSTKKGRASWNYDNADEFFADYGPSIETGSIRASIYTVEAPVSGPHNASASLNMYAYPGLYTLVTVDAPHRSTLLRPFSVFRNWADKNPVSAEAEPTSPLKIFIGHGRSHDWRDLKDALVDHHGFHVETFETRPRAGYTIPDVIESMATGNTLALMVLTAEDEQQDGSIRARENVVHEVGYFQGRLGNRRAILIMEEGVNEFSNIHGIIHLPYRNIREVTGEVLAVIKREFPHLGLS